MQPLPHQLATSKLVFDMLRQRKYCLLQGEVRSGKTLTALLALSYSRSISRILILTKKAAIPGINKFIDDPELQSYWSHQQHTVINYEALGRFVERTVGKSGKPLAKPISEPQFKLNPDDYDLIVLDEIHVLGKLGKPSQRYKLLSAFAPDLPWLGMSGTSFVESPNQIYYETSFSSRTPFPQKSFYAYFKEWGVPAPIQIGYNEFRETYKQAKPELLTYINDFSVILTQADAGIQATATDELHFVPLSNLTRTYYNKLQSDRILHLPPHTVVADSIMALRTKLHQLEGSTIKLDDDYIQLPSLEKVNYIKQVWGDLPSVGIMCYYKEELNLLQQHFKHAQLYSSIRHAEGVDLSHLDHLVIYSFGFSGSKFIQFRDRQTNVNSNSQNIVHFLLTRDAISHQCYDAVSTKRDFNSAIFLQRNL